MNTPHATARKWAVNTISLAILSLALIAGIFFGRLSNPTTPAQAETPEPDPSVCFVCGSGSGGNMVPDAPSIPTPVASP